MGEKFTEIIGPRSRTPELPLLVILGLFSCFLFFLGGGLKDRFFAVPPPPNPKEGNSRRLSVRSNYYSNFYAMVRASPLPR